MQKCIVFYVRVKVFNLLVKKINKFRLETGTRGLCMPKNVVQVYFAIDINTL